MSTKLVKQLMVNTTTLENTYKTSWTAFMDGDESTPFEPTFKKITALLANDPWQKMDNSFVYDHKIRACWLGLAHKYTHNNYIVLSNQTPTATALTKLKKRHKAIPHVNDLTLPTLTELKNSLTNLTRAPFAITGGRPAQAWAIKYNKTGKAQTFLCRNNDHRDIVNDGYAIPLLRLANTEDHFALPERVVFFRWVALGLTPDALKNDADYAQILTAFNHYTLNIQDKTNLTQATLKTGITPSVNPSDIMGLLLNEDKLRADLAPYHAKQLEDINQGHWSLWQVEPASKTNKKTAHNKNQVTANLTEPLVARDPKSAIIDGTVGIDFGTKSTVVVYQKDTTTILPMRIGTGDLTQAISSTHYENPTIMELNDFEQFFSDYTSQNGRPHTKWADLTISHTANNALLNSQSEHYSSFISELKQWAGNKNKKLKIKDKKGYVLDLEPFMSLSENSINPIEIYAYYLGLYINNQTNGIYMNYILSFPVTYETEIRDKIIDSFRKGIAKSLPQQLHDQPGEIEKLSITKGASEPAAYAVVALQAYDFDPCDDDKDFYSVFDFGGGTTDFDFGIYREANGPKERRYDYAIEHFGAGGDRYLGGENILELLAFEVFKANKDALLKESIQFILPPECGEFLGSEALLSTSREAKLNTLTLMEALRPFWENHPDKQADFENGTLEVNLTTLNAKQLTNFELDFNKDAISDILYKRIEKGIDNFFHSLRLAFNNYGMELNSIKKINIFLAGNSSKSLLVTDIFNKKITQAEAEFNQAQNTSEQGMFKLFPPLGNNDKEGDEGKPTGKTGVAFGLIETRQGGDILVIDHNTTKNDNINFKYYLGESRKKKFKTLVDREEALNKWVEFVDATQNTFEVYYSSQSTVSNNKTPINDSGIKKMKLTIDTVDDNAYVYIRVVSPTCFEYVVALEDSIENAVYLNDITKVTL